MAASPNSTFAFKITIAVRDRFEFENIIERLIDFLNNADLRTVSEMSRN